MRADSLATRYRAIPATLPSSAPQATFPLGRLCLHQFLQYRILHDHPGGVPGGTPLRSTPGVPVPDALPHKDALCRRKPSAAAFIRRGCSAR